MSSYGFEEAAEIALLIPKIRLYVSDVSCEVKQIGIMISVLQTFMCHYFIILRCHVESNLWD